MKLLDFLDEERGQDIMEYAVIVAIAVTAVAVLGVLFATIRSKLADVNQEMQAWP